MTAPKRKPLKAMTREDFIRQAAEARKTMQELARLFPGCFHADGRPIVASAHFPTLKETQGRTEGEQS